MRSDVTGLPVEMRANGMEIRGGEWGRMALKRVELPAGADLTPMLQGLPDDLCPCPHWGRVLGGDITLRYADGTEEVARAGDFFHWPAGHTARTDDGVVFLEISPADQLRAVMEHVAGVMGG